MAVDAPTQAIEWAELLRGDGGESAVADPVGPPDPNEPVTHAKVIAQSVAPPLVVGTRVVSLIEQADVDRRRLHDHASQESVGRRPTKVVRDARGAPVGLDTPGGLIVDGTREVPSQTFSKWGLLVFGVLFVVLLAWLCSGPSTRPGGPGGSTPCTVSALDLRGEPVTVDC